VHSYEGSLHALLQLSLVMQRNLNFRQETYSLVYTWGASNVRFRASPKSRPANLGGDFGFAGPDFGRISQHRGGVGE